jgi:hypothetical protein
LILRKVELAKKKRTYLKHISEINCKCILFYYISTPSRASASFAFHGSKPQTVVSWMGEPAELGRRPHWEAMRAGIGPSKNLQLLGDEGRWIWNLKGDRWRQAKEMLNFYRRSEHLRDLGWTAQGEA